MLEETVDNYWFHCTHITIKKNAQRCTIVVVTTLVQGKKIIKI